MAQANVTPSKRKLRKIGIAAFTVVAGSLVPALVAQSPASAGKNSTARLISNQMQRRAQTYYEGVWGIDSLQVKYTESGEMIRFSYRVIDPVKAAGLNDGKIDPVLVDPQAGVKLSIPQMQNVGKLRQSSTPEAGKSYWMAFSNKGRLVRPGHRVSLVIGHFTAQNLPVE